MKKIKYMSKTVTIAAATYADEKVQIAELELDKAYDRCTGVAIHRILDSGVANGNYKIGLANDNGAIHDATHISSWSTAKDDGTNPNERFKDLNVPVSGVGLMQCKVVMPAQTIASALSVEFVFRLEQDQVRTN